jgi:hypothetical protein
VEWFKTGIGFAENIFASGDDDLVATVLLTPFNP